MPAKILLIEDDETIVTLLDYNLRSSGYDVAIAPSAEEGELILAEQLIDLVVLDWMLPDMSGIELCGRLRRTGKLPRIPILMLTARGEEADRVRGFANG
ncbi:MAG: response regulator, partial [Hyphomicrobium sp.]